MNRRDFLKLGATGAVATSIPAAMFNATSEEPSLYISTEEILEAREIIIKNDYIFYEGVWCNYWKDTSYRVDLSPPSWQHIIKFNLHGGDMVWCDITHSDEFPEIPFPTKRM